MAAWVEMTAEQERQYEESQKELRQDESVRAALQVRALMEIAASLLGKIDCYQKQQRREIERAIAFTGDVDLSMEKYIGYRGVE